MWLCTKIGFYSIVKKGVPGTWQIRARAPKDLDNLIVATRIDVPVIKTPNGDYGWRIVVDAAQLGRIFQTLAESVDYTNFKDCIAHTADQRGKLNAYHDFWGGMFALQTNHRRTHE